MTSDVVKSGAVILIATCAFAGVAFTNGAPGSTGQCPESREIIRYFPAPEPQPIYPRPRLLPVNDFGPQPFEERIVEKADEPEIETGSIRRHRRVVRHHRRHRGRHK